MTFSIVAWDALTGMTGVAVATKHLAVGALVPHARATVGAIATQAQTNPMLGIQGLDLLAARHTATADWVLGQLLQADSARDERQVHLVNPAGQSAAWTGKHCVDWAGHQTYPGFSVAGNMLVGETVLTAMAEAYRQAEMEPFSRRLLFALEAGDAAGGDKRGRQSASLYVVERSAYPHLDLRIDHHSQPIVALRELYEESCKPYYQSFRQSMPTGESAPVQPVDAAVPIDSARWDIAV